MTGALLTFTVMVQVIQERGTTAAADVEQRIAPGSHSDSVSFDVLSDCVETVANVGYTSSATDGQPSTELLWDSGEEELHFARPARCKKVAKVIVYCRACNKRSGACGLWQICRTYYRYECDPNRL